MNTQTIFTRKLSAYFDGTLKDSEKAEFEASIGSSPENAKLFRQKETEYNSLKARIPSAPWDEDLAERLETEVSEVVQNLFKDEEASIGKRLSTWFKEKI